MISSFFFNAQNVAVGVGNIADYSMVTKQWENVSP